MIVLPDASFSGRGLSGTFKLRGSTIGDIGAGHAHNGAGTYSISLNDQLIAGDLGRGNFYDSNSFTALRYDNIIYNSYTHPVPYLNDNVLQIQSKFADPNLRVLSRSSSLSSE